MLGSVLAAFATLVIVQSLCAGGAVVDATQSSMLSNSGHPYHRVRPIMLCSDSAHGALQSELSSGPGGVPLQSCAWRLGDPPPAEAIDARLNVANVGRRYLIYDTFARDGQVFAILPSYRRAPFTWDGLLVYARLERAESKWVSLGSPVSMRTVPPRAQRALSAKVIRWRLPAYLRRDLPVEAYINVCVTFAGRTYPLRLFHVEFLQKQMGAAPVRPGGNFAASAFRENPDECVRTPGWDCLWPRAEKNAPSTAHRKSPGTGTQSSNDVHLADPRPHRVVATTMMLLEDRERYLPTWAAYHAARGLEALVAYRNDDEWVQGACIAAAARDEYCKAVWPLGPSHPKAPSMLGAGLMGSDICHEQQLEASELCLPQVRQTISQEPVVLELSWPFRMYNAHSLDNDAYAGEAQPHAQQHFLFKYGKPLTEWMVHQDLDEYLNVTSVLKLAAAADEHATTAGELLPASIEFSNRYALASLQPTVESNFTVCPPEELLLHPSMPIARCVGSNSPMEEAIRATLENAGLQAGWVSAIAPIRSQEIARRVAAEVDMSAARSQLAQQGRPWDWPVIVEPADTKERYKAAGKITKYMARTDLVQWANIHNANLATSSDPALKQWHALSGAQCRPWHAGSGAVPVAPTKGMLQSEDLASPCSQPAHVTNARLHMDGAVLLHFLEWSTSPKLALEKLCARLPPCERLGLHDGRTPLQVSVGAWLDVSGLHRQNNTQIACGNRVLQALYLRGVQLGWGPDSEESPTEMVQQSWPVPLRATVHDS